MAREAASDFRAYQEGASARQKEQDQSDGSLAAAAGQVDPEREAESKAYQAGVLWQRGDADWSTRRSNMEQGLQQLIQKQTDPDPAKREAEVAVYLEQQNHDFALSEDGSLRDFGSPDANRHFAAQMLATREALLPQAAGLIRKRMGEESLANMATAVVGKLKAGIHVDPAEEFSRLLPFVDRREAVETFMQATEAAAGELQQSDPTRGLKMIDGLLGWAKQASPEAQPQQPAAAPTQAPAGLMQPFAGFASVKRTGKMGDARSGGSAHNGEDFPVPVGTSIVAPMGGEVVSSMRNARGGNQVRVKLDNGAIVGFAHLSSRGVQVGQRVEAGAELGLSGNTGKSTGPHVHMTFEVGGKKVSPSGYFSEQPASSRAVSSPAFQAAFGDVGSADAVPQADAGPGGELGADTLTGPLSLSPGQILHLQEFRRMYSQRAEAEAEREKSERQATTAASFISRLSGATGTYPTAAEVQSLIRAGAVAPQQGMQLLNIIDSDRRQRISDARQAASWAREDRQEAKEDYLRGRVGSLLGPVYAGRSSVTDATGKLLAVVAREADPEIRQALLREVGGELNNVQTLRVKGPEYRGADNDLNSWEEAYSGQLGKVRMPRGVDGQAARRLIRAKLDEVRTELGRGDVSPEKVRDYMGGVERRMDLWFQQTFPPRALKR
nr:M23 family metallopeptidase [Novosphingobium panipatense]